MSTERPAGGADGSEPSAPADASGFRPDLEGLRGLAIAAVLLFHAGVPLVGGGYVGVDVFFVLSGYLITRLLLAERERTGQIDLRGFYARRARRILPAALVVILGTLAASWLVLAPLDVLRVADDATAAALFVGNIHFANTAMDYFAAGQAPSPLLHYWSLGVEEQFYLLWPALLILACRGSRIRIWAGLAVVAVIATSFAASLVLTDAAQAWAFFSLPTRAWQLGLGGLLAVVAVPLRWPRSLRPAVTMTAALIGWAGLAAIVAACLLLDSGTPYPGLAALLPTVGAAALIAAGARRGSPAILLRLPPMRFLGRISYSVYLVHWPLLVLPAAGLAIGDELDPAARFGLLVLSIGLGWLSWRIVEQPFQRPRLALDRPGRTFAGAAAMVAVVIVAAGAAATGATETMNAYLAGGPALAAAGTTDEGQAGTAGPTGGAPTDLPAAIAGALPAESDSPPPTSGAEPSPIAVEPSAEPSPGSAPVAAPTSAATDSATATPGPVATAAGLSVTTSPSPSVPPPHTASPTPAATAAAANPRAAQAPPRDHPRGPQPLPPGVQPPLLAASNDLPAIDRDGCTVPEVAVTPRSCVFGNPQGAVTVALVGDSHAAQWFPALLHIADERGWRLVTFTKLACRFTDLPEYSRTLKREYTECEQWRELVVQRLAALRPDLVVVSMAQGMQPMVQADWDPKRQGEGMARLLDRIPGRKAVIVDTPWWNGDVPTCISRHLADVTACERSRVDAFGWQHLTAERTATAETGATLVDLNDRICPYDPCPVVLDRMIVYRDSFHLTATFAESLAPELEARLPRPGAGG